MSLKKGVAYALLVIYPTQVMTGCGIRSEGPVAGRLTSIGFERPADRSDSKNEAFLANSWLTGEVESPGPEAGMVSLQPDGSTLVDFQGEASSPRGDTVRVDSAEAGPNSRSFGEGRNSGENSENQPEMEANGDAGSAHNDHVGPDEDHPEHSRGVGAGPGGPGAIAIIAGLIVEMVRELPRLLPSETSSASESPDPRIGQEVYDSKRELLSVLQDAAGLARDSSFPTSRMPDFPEVSAKPLSSKQGREELERLNESARKAEKELELLLEGNRIRHERWRLELAREEKAKTEFDGDIKRWTELFIEPQGALEKEFQSAGIGSENRHNAGIQKAQESLPQEFVITLPGVGSERPEDSLPDSPEKKSIQRARRQVEYVKSSQREEGERHALHLAHELLDAAAVYASHADTARASHRVKASDTLARYAIGTNPGSERNGNDRDGVDRESVRAAAWELFDAALVLDEQGQSELADQVLEHAKLLLDAAIVASRMLPTIDRSLTILEVFAGRTIDLREDGTVYFREVTTGERAVSIVELVLTTSGALAGGPAGAIAAGTLLGVGKAIGKKEGKRAAASVGEKATAEGLAQAETELRKRTAIELSEQAGRELGLEAERLARLAGTMNHVSPRTAKHIIEGDFTSTGLLKGGLHTGPATDRYVKSLPENLRAKISRETLPNGVERTVFPPNAIDADAYLRTEEASRFGKGVPGGKTAFPRDWDPGTINRAIGEVAKNGTILRQSQGSWVKTGIVDGVDVSVQAGPKKGGGTQINSAYPNWNQGGSPR